MSEIRFTYRQLEVTIIQTEYGYRFYNEAEQILSGTYKTRAEALDEAIKKAHEDADYYGTDK
jgi:hypothetical protein